MKLILIKKRSKKIYHITELERTKHLVFFTICNQKVKDNSEWDHHLWSRSASPIEFLRNKINLCKKCKKALDNAILNGIIEEEQKGKENDHGN